jgi:uncharacterized membrane protein
MNSLKMGKSRVEAFSDGVLAVAITLMVLELKVPHGDDLSVLIPILPKFLGYILSFLYLGIYWNNHHHLFQASQNIKGSVLWANHHLLFWLTMIPFATGWLGEHHLSPIPIIVYGAVLLMSAIAYFILQKAIIAADGPESMLKKALASDWKGKLSPLGYSLAMLLAYWLPWVSLGIYLFMAFIWLVPDSRIEKQFKAG